jgi:hypothetical protein
MSSVLPNSQVLNEDTALVDGVDAACGPTAAYSAAGIVNGFNLSVAGLKQLVQRAMGSGTLDTGGQQFSNGPQWDLAQYGIDSDVTTPGSPVALEATLNTALRNNKPAVLGLANANQLTGEPPDLFGHFVTVVGSGPAGYEVADPNLGQITQNSLGQLFAAQPASVTIPTRGAQGTAQPFNNSGLLSDTASNGIGFPSLISVQLPDIETSIETGMTNGIAGAFEKVWADLDVGKMFIRSGVFIIGGLIFLVSLEKLLESFNIPTPVTIARDIQKGTQEKAKDIVSLAGAAGAL